MKTKGAKFYVNTSSIVHNKNMGTIETKGANLILMYALTVVGKTLLKKHYNNGNKGYKPLGQARLQW